MSTPRLTLKQPTGDARGVPEGVSRLSHAGGPAAKLKMVGTGLRAVDARLTRFV